MKPHEVRVHPSKANLAREDQLAWKIAGGRRRQGRGGARRRGDDRQPHDRQRRRRDRRDQPPSGRIGARRGARRMRARRRRDGVRRPGDGYGSARNGRRGRTGRRCASWTCTTPSSPPTTRIPGDNIPPILAVAQTMGRSGARPDPRHRDRLRDPDRPGAGDLPARAQDRPHRPSLPGAGGRHRHAAAAADGDDLPGGAAGGACQLHHAPVAQGRDQFLEGVSPRRTPASWRSRRWIAAMRGEGRAEPDLRRRGQRHRLDAGRPGRASIRCRCRSPGEAKRAILDSYTKEHSAEYQSQALIDLAFRMREQICRTSSRSSGSSSTPATTRIT